MVVGSSHTYWASVGASHNFVEEVIYKFTLLRISKVLSLCYL